MGKQKVTVPNGVQEFRIPDLAELFSTSTAYWYKLIAQGKVTGRRHEKTGEWLIPRKQVMGRAALRNAQVERAAAPSAPRAPRPRGIASMPQFQYVLVPTETLALYRGLVEELTALTAQVNELKEARTRKGG